MRQRTAGDRIRVAIAGNIYAKRALVRRFLEDDGFAVVSEANDKDQLFSSLSQEPDAVVLDDDIADWQFSEIQKAAPGVKIVLFTAGPPTQGHVPPGADGYLQKGVGLGQLTSLLRTLLAEPAVVVIPSAPPVQRGPQHERRVVLRLGAIAAALVLLAGAALFLIGPGNQGERAAQPSVQPTTAPPVRDALQMARIHLRELRQALSQGQYQQASALARLLAADRQTARLHGFSISTLDQSVRDALQPLLGSLAPGFIPTLRTILGSLVPPLPPAPTGGGGGIVLPGPVAPSGGGGGTGGNGGGGGGGGGTGGNDGGGGGGSGGGGTTAPGSGHHRGWSNKPPAHGWKGQNPKRHGPKG